MTEELENLLIEFDEMGYCPTTLCRDPEKEAIEWKRRLVAEIGKLEEMLQNVERMCLKYALEATKGQTRTISLDIPSDRATDEEVKEKLKHIKELLEKKGNFTIEPFCNLETYITPSEEMDEAYISKMRSKDE